MSNWLTQRFTPQPRDIFLIYHEDNSKEAAFLEKILEENFACRVSTHPWDVKSSLAEPIRSPTATEAFLVLFVLTNKLLNNLDDEGFEALCTLAAPSQQGKTYSGKESRRHSEARKSKGRAVFVEHCDNQDKLKPKLNHLTCEGQDENAKNRFINMIYTPGLRRRSREQAQSSYLPAPRSGPLPQAASPTGSLQLEPPGTGALQSSPPSPAADGSPSSAPAWVAQLPIWVVPSEYKAHTFMELEVVQRNDNPIHKGEVLSFLHERFRERNRVKPYQVLYGMVGAGKTTLAAEYAYTYGRHDHIQIHQKPYSIVLWLDASQQLRNTFSDLSKRHKALQALADGQGDPEQKLKEWLNEVESWLQGRNERWLLIIDHCKGEEFHLIDELLPTQAKSGDILVITRRQPDIKRPEDDISYLKVKGLCEEDGANLLAELCGRSRDTPEEHQQAKNIARALEGLPQAISYAALSIKGSADSDYASFLKRYHNTWVSNSNPVLRALEVLLNEVREDNFYADTILLQCSMLGKEPIPEILIEKLLPQNTGNFSNNKYTFDAVKTTLARFSFLEGEGIREQGRPWTSPQGERLIALRPIVRQVNEMRIKDIADNKREDYAREIVEAVSRALPQEKWQPRWAAWPFYLPHLCKCVAYIKEYNINTIGAVRLLYMAGCFIRAHPQQKLPLQEHGNEMKACDLLLRAVRMRRKLLYQQLEKEDTYPNLPTCENAVAELYYDRFLHRKIKTLNIQGKVSSITGPERIRGYIERKYHKALKEIQPRTNQADVEDRNVSRAIILNNLGRLYNDFSEYEKAKESFEDALKALKVQQGPRPTAATREDRLTRTIILNNLALTLMQDGNFNEAEEKLSEALEEIVVIKNESSSFSSEWVKRCEEHEAQCKANRANLSIIQGKMPSPVLVGQDLDNAIQSAKRALQDAKAFGGPSEADYLRLLRRLNNRAEFHRFYAQMSKDHTREEEEKAVALYEHAIDEFQEWTEYEEKLCEPEMSFPHPLLFIICENFKQLKENMLFKYERRGSSYYESKVAEIRQDFRWLKNKK